MKGRPSPGVAYSIFDRVPFYERVLNSSPQFAVL
jgi:hypothetical protein